MALVTNDPAVNLPRTDGSASGSERVKIGQADPLVRTKGSLSASRAAGLSPAHQLLWQHLQVWAYGRDYARTRKQICASLAGANSEGARAFVDIKDRAFKQLTKDLLTAGYLALSCDHGYYAGRDSSDVQHFRRYILKKARPMLNLGRLARFAMEDEALRRMGRPVPVQRTMRRVMA